MFSPPDDHAPTSRAKLADDPIGRSHTEPSRREGTTTPDSLLGIGGSEQQVVREAIKARLFPATASQGDRRSADGSDSSKIDRFTVLGRIGEGGMGVVFAAYDDELDRKIAIKLLRSRHRGEDRSRTRLLREAQALARLSHPNVVQVHEVGEWRGEVYLAMEFVPGTTLRKWLVRPRPWSAIVDVLIQAGHGLQAAHAAGLVHRDFKPDNVMVGAEGRVRVLDFGLVRASEGLDPAESSEEPTPEVDPIPRPLALSLTRTGSVLGTPMYMAPEQHLGEPADALGDQFSFCVTAYEALFGRRPFESDSLIGMIEAASTGVIQAVPKDSRVPRRIREAVLRGLSPDRARRWPSIAELLTEFERGRRRRATPGALLAAGSAGAIVAGVLALAWPTAQPAPSCTSVDASALAGTWDDARRTQIEQAMLSTQLPYAASSFAALAEALDGWSSEWVAAEQQACAATHVHGVQSSAVLEHQQACLRGQARRVEGVLEVFASADQAVVERTDELLDELPDPSRCRAVDDHESLDPALALRVEALESELVEVKGLIIAGKWERADEQLAVVQREAEGLVHPSTELRIRGLALELEWGHGHQPELVERWRALANEARLWGFDDLEAQLRAELAIAMVRNLSTMELERWLIEDAELVLAVRDERTTPRALALRRAKLQWLGRAGHYDEAKTGYLELIGEADQRGWLGLAAQARHSLANVEADMGDLDAAERDYQSARVSLVERWGPEHPNVGAIDHDLAVVAMDRGDFDQARVLLDRAESIHRGNPGSLALADDRSARVALALYTGELDHAGELVRAALEVYERELGPEHETTVRMLELRGIIRYFEGDFVGSLVDYERVLPRYRTMFGEQDVQIGLLHVNRGDTLLALGRLQDALVEHELAYAILSVAVPGQGMIGSALAGRGEARLGLGEHELAIADLEAALLVIEPGEPTERAEAEFALARALAASGRDPGRVAELGDRARASFEQLGLTTQLETLDRWRGH